MIPQQAMKSVHIGITDKRDAVGGVLHTLAVGSDLNEEPPRLLEVLPQEVVEWEHVLFLAELHVVGDILQYFWHKH